MKELKKILMILTVAGNILFMLWVTYNGIDEHFQGTVWQKLSYIGLMGLLMANTYLVLGGRPRSQ